MSQLPPSPFSQRVRDGAVWLSGAGPEADVVISSRVRLARNLRGLPFVNRATPDDLGEVAKRVRGRAEALGAKGLAGGERGAGEACDRLWVDVHTLSALDRQLLVERHLISKELSKGDTPRGLIVSLPDERLSVMVNEEDHLRIQAVLPGLCLDEAWKVADRADDELEAGLDFAFHERFGYLTACPTNVGLGLRMSVMLHLPGLRLTGDIEKARRAAKDMSLTVRGFYGEGSEALGDLYQISNQTTLGKPEDAIHRELAAEIIPQVIQFERAARVRLLQKRRSSLEDGVYRALGVLRACRLLTPEEALSLLSMVRLGVLTGLVTGVSEQAVNQLIVLTQPSHLQRLIGEEMDQQRRREARAELVRERLRGV